MNYRKATNLVCLACGVPHGRRIGTWYCKPCARLIKLFRRREKIGSAIETAVRRGELPRPFDLRCVDCREYRASVYEHRDYFKPLDVRPVCGGCNAYSGPALTVLNNIQHFYLEAA